MPHGTHSVEICSGIKKTRACGAPTTSLRSFQENPGHFWFASISGSFALFFTLSMCFRQSQALSKRPLCMQRTYYRGLESGKNVP